MKKVVFMGLVVVGLMMITPSAYTKCKWGVLGCNEGGDHGAVKNLGKTGQETIQKNELPRSKLRGIKPPLAYSHGPASLAGWMLVYRVDVLYVLHAHLRTTPTGCLGDAVAYSLFHCPAA